VRGGAARADDTLNFWNVYKALPLLHIEKFSEWNNVDVLRHGNFSKRSVRYLLATQRVMRAPATQAERVGTSIRDG